MSGRALLMDERVIALQPALIRALDGDLVGAVVLQQIAYWMPHATAEHDGHLWVYKTHADMAEETALSTDQCHRATKKLEARGVLISCQPNGRDRVKWYRIDEDHPVLNPVPMSRQREMEVAPARDGSRASAICSIPTESTHESTALEALEIFDAWVAAVGKNPAATKLTKDRTTAIRARRREGYTVDVLVAAVRGIAMSPFHMGINDERRPYNELTLALRNGTNVEKFAKIYEDGEVVGATGNANLDAVADTIAAYEAAGIEPGSLFGVGR